MLQDNISRAVLTIGNRVDKPDGGISQVLYSYRRHVFTCFKHVVNYKRGPSIYKICVTIWGYVTTLIYLLFDNEIRIVHIHTASDNGFIRNVFFVRLAYALKRRVVLHIHSGRFNDYYLNHKEQVDKVLRNCSEIVVLSQKIKEFYETWGYKNVSVINNIIEYPQIKKLEPDHSTIHFLYLGVITKTKGIYDLINVLNNHKTEFDGKMILHVGGNCEVDNLLQMIKDNHLENIVKYEGWVSGNKKIEMFNMCDVFILPSYTEGLPISILEAQSYGLFTVATSVGAIPEIVNSDNGVLFAPQDKSALYGAIKQLIDNDSFREKRQLIQKGVTDYLPESVARQLESMYVRVLSQNSRL